MSSEPSQILYSFFLTCLLFFILTITTNAQIYVTRVCNTTSDYTQGSQYRSNLNHVLTTLASNITPIGFSTTISGARPNQVYGLLQCIGDVSYEACRTCASASTKEILQQCPNNKEAVLFYNFCMLQYADHPIFSKPNLEIVVHLRNEQNTTNPVLFNRVLRELMNNLSSKAASDPSKFAIGGAPFGELGNLYGLVQCNRDLSKTDCLRCLQVMYEFRTNSTTGFQKSIGAQIRSTTCIIRYENYLFYESSTQAASPAPPGVVDGNSSTRTNNTSSNHGGEWRTRAGSFVVHRKRIIFGVLVVTAALVTLVVLLIYRRSISSNCHLMFYRWSTKNRKNFNVEAFFENYGHGPLALHRHTYSNLKKITNGFKDKLGQGGYGSVFKGKLRDGRLVAVKVLTESKGNGEDFVNELAAISRTNHVNIVSLIGFCFERSKRALVYEYMPNGSLEKFIYDEKSPSSTHPLGWEKLHQIALGIANGLEYLHRGCTTRILHFDIKPHNILLDKDFCPKISDFGLAKLCPTRESTVSMLNARGTIGYIAPEICCRNFGGVSSKSDVYSYGMMVLEMVGGRKNIDPTTKTSEIYFPQWIYNRLEQYDSVGLGEIDDSFEEESIRKMMTVGLWCIQTHPATRPSMSMVVEMLQKPVKDLQMPPNPFQDPPTCTIENLQKSSSSIQHTLTSTSSQSNL